MAFGRFESAWTIALAALSSTLLAGCEEAARRPYDDVWGGSFLDGGELADADAEIEPSTPITPVVKDPLLPLPEAIGPDGGYCYKLEGQSETCLWDHMTSATRERRGGLKEYDPLRVLAEARTQHGGLVLKFETTMPLRPSSFPVVGTASVLWLEISGTCKYKGADGQPAEVQAACMAKSVCVSGVVPDVSVDDAKENSSVKLRYSARISTSCEPCLGVVDGKNVVCTSFSPAGPFDVTEWIDTTLSFGSW